MSWRDTLNLSPAEIELLQQNFHLLTPEEQADLAASLQLIERGCRTNKYIDAIRPQLHPKQIRFLELDCLEAMFGGAAGGGKVLYDDGEILTPFGFKRGIDLRVGDAVNNPDGTVAKIVQLHLRQKYQVWRVKFHDGSFTDVAREHLWQAWRSGKRKKRKNVGLFGYAAREVIETQELKRWCDKAIEQQKRGKRPEWPCIPVCQPQVFNVSRKYPCTLDPYVLGAWLGNGHSSDGSVIFSMNGDDAAEFATEFEYEHTRDGKGDANCVAFRITGECRKLWCRELEKVGLTDTKAATKFIPDEFLYGGVEARTAILQGLMDTDGYVDERGQCYFTSVSKRLADGVRFIVQSLGGTATEFSSVGSYRDEEGNLVECQVAYTLYIKLPDERDLFRMSRKKSRCTTDGSLMYRRVVEVEILDEYKSGRCITVSHPNGLYLTNDFIVTHNSDALLLAALQYVDYPGYSAIIFRKTFTDLSGKGAIMDRAQTWLREFSEVHWSAEKKTFTFPSGATLAFSYLQDPDDHLRYQGWEFQFVAFDELTQHREDQYRYLFSRLRRLKDSSIPIRMRSATNPGGPGGEWVKNRFVSDEFLAASVEEQFSKAWDKTEECEECEGTGVLHSEQCLYCDGAGTITRVFVPSKIDDNPSLDRREYAKSLALLPPLERLRLQSGRWDVMETGELFKQSWFRYYEPRGEHYRLFATDGSIRISPHGSRLVFTTADTASKEKTTADPTVICTWAMTREYDLLLLGVIRERMEIPKIAPVILQEARRFGSDFVLIEDAASGIGVIQELRGVRGGGLTVKGYSPANRDKVARSTIAQIRMSEGQVYFPVGENKTLTECQNELLAFPLGAHDDFVDNLSMAAWWVSTQAGQHSDRPPEVVTAGMLPAPGLPESFRGGAFGF